MYDFKRKCDIRLRDIDNDIDKRDIRIYGAGRGGDIVLEWLLEKGYKPVSYVERSVNGLKTKNGLKIILKTEISPKTDFIIVSLMSFDLCVLMELGSHGFGEHDMRFISYCDSIKNTTGTIFKGIDIGRFTYGYECFLQGVDCSFVKTIGSFCS